MKLNCSLGLIGCGCLSVFFSGLVFFVFVRVELQMSRRESQQKALTQRILAIEKRISSQPLTENIHGRYCLFLFSSSISLYKIVRTEFNNTSFVFFLSLSLVLLTCLFV